MQSLALRHVLHCDEDTFWTKCVFDADYNEALYLQVLGFERYEQVGFSDDGETIRRAVHASPKMPAVPEVVKKVLGNSLAYVETGAFSRKARRYTFTAIPTALAGKATTTGSIAVEMLGPRILGRTVNLTVDVRVFLVGGLIEDQILASLRESYERAASFTDEWVKRKGH